MIFTHLICSNFSIFRLNTKQQLAQHIPLVGYTMWRKKNACFSNNCNFVYFQYKKIMSTPKQPVINAVLITYIDYSFTENYIGKKASFLPYTRPEPLLKVLHYIY